MIGRKATGHAGPFHQVAADRWPVSTHTHARLRPAHRRWEPTRPISTLRCPGIATVHWPPRSSAGRKRHSRSEVDIRWPWQGSPTTNGDGAEGRVARQRPEAAHPSDHRGRYLDDLRQAGAGQGTTVCHPSLPPSDAVHSGCGSFVDHTPGYMAPRSAPLAIRICAACSVL